MKAILRIILFCFVVASLIFGCVRVGSAQVPTSPTYTGSINDANVYFPLYFRGKQYKVPGSEVGSGNDTLIAGSGLHRIGDTLKLGANTLNNTGLLTEDCMLVRSPNSYLIIAEQSNTWQSEGGLGLFAGSPLTSEWYSQIQQVSSDTASRLTLTRVTPLGVQGIDMGILGKMLVSDNVNTVGLEYASKYRPDNDRWLTDKEYVDSASASGTLQSVTTNGNSTPKSIQLTGMEDVDYNVKSATIGLTGIPDPIFKVFYTDGEGDGFDLISITTGQQVLITDGDHSLTLRAQTPTVSGALFSSRVQGYPALTDSNFVTLKQLQDTLNTYNFNINIHEKGSANIVGDGATTSFDINFTAFPVTTNYMVIVTPRSETPSPWFIPSQSNGQFTIQFNDPPPLSPPAAPVVIDYLIVEY